MSKTFRPWKIDEPLLLPPVVQEFVAKDHLARFVLNLVSSHRQGGPAADGSLFSVWGRQRIFFRLP